MRTIFVCAGAAALAMVWASFSFGAPRLIAVDSSRALYEIDMNTGAKTQIGTVSTNASTTAGLAYDRATGTVYLTSTGNDSVQFFQSRLRMITAIGEPIVWPCLTPATTSAVSASIFIRPPRP